MPLSSVYAHQLVINQPSVMSIHFHTVIFGDIALIWSCLLSIKEGTTNAQQNQFNYQ